VHANLRLPPPRDLEQVLAARNDLFVLARTDSDDRNDILEWVEALAATGAGGVLVDGVRDLEMINEIRARVDVPIAFN